LQIAGTKPPDYAAQYARLQLIVQDVSARRRGCGNGRRGQLGFL
jgi:hypothetical protein